MNQRKGGNHRSCHCQEKVPRGSGGPRTGGAGGGSPAGLSPPAGGADSGGGASRWWRTRRARDWWGPGGKPASGRPWSPSGDAQPPRPVSTSLCVSPSLFPSLSLCLCVSPSLLSLPFTGGLNYNSHYSGLGSFLPLCPGARARLASRPGQAPACPAPRAPSPCPVLCRALPTVPSGAAE